MQIDGLYHDMARFCNNALNRTLTKTSKVQRQLIRTRYSLSNKTIRRLTKTKKSQIDTLEVTIRNAIYKLSLNRFKRLQKRTGVLVKLGPRDHLFIQGGFLGAKRGETKVRNKGFLATRRAQSFAGITTSSSTLYSHSRQRSPRGSQVFYFRTKPFNLIAQEQNARLLAKAYEIFAQELAHE
ncbi:hypothetical protein [Helicobacter labacensis]|uniref:hypothetical protein n=1 Tax=Helicobacter labacensis TaxID=2316079 RepID=UPI0013CDE2DF|nr:hypothetical protein [Helicobacter labacensis]